MCCDIDEAWIRNPLLIDLSVRASSLQKTKCLDIGEVRRVNIEIFVNFDCNEHTQRWVDIIEDWVEYLSSTLEHEALSFYVLKLASTYTKKHSLACEDSPTHGTEFRVYHREVNPLIGLNIEEGRILWD